MRSEALLLLGPTGSGKTPLGDWLEQVSLWGRRCHHFDFGANLRAIAAGEIEGPFSPAEVNLLRRVLEVGALLEPEHFSLAARILDAFLVRRGMRDNDLLVLNGLPRHRQQAEAIDRRLNVILVVQLECDAATVAERLRRDSGGDRTQRTDDAYAFVARKLAVFEERTRPLLDHYRERGVPRLKVLVDVVTQPVDIMDRLEASANLC